MTDTKRPPPISGAQFLHSTSADLLRALAQALDEKNAWMARADAAEAALAALKAEKAKNVANATDFAQMNQE